MNFESIVHYRRSVRYYKDIPLNTEKVKHCIELATLSPNSSNMQLWQFYHITDKKIIDKLAVACFHQTAATTAQQMVVFITRKDLYRKRAKEIMKMEIDHVLKNSPKEKHEKRIKKWKKYYGVAIPFVYARCWGILGLFRKIFVNITGLFQSIYYQVSECDTRVVVHKSCALAAQTFMLAMASEKYDTCPMEGFDSKKVKKILKLPYGSEINMIVSCGIRDEQGVRGERKRIPFDDVYKEIYL